MEQNWVWGIECPKLDHVPGPIWDIPSWIWDMDHPKSKFRFGMHEIEISIWDIPGWIWDMVTFGLQHVHLRISNITFLEKKLL